MVCSPHEYWHGQTSTIVTYMVRDSFQHRVYSHSLTPSLGSINTFSPGTVLLNESDAFGSTS